MRYRFTRAERHKVRTRKIERRFVALVESVYGRDTLPQPEDYSYCPVCGEELEWVDCWSCGGEGFHDDYEDDPINNDPGDESPCPECHGEGGWEACVNKECRAVIPSSA